MTLDDMFGQIGFSGGGLRGGGYELEPSGYALHEMTDVRGVALSGKLRVVGTSLKAKLTDT